MPIDEKDMQTITRRLDERYVKREDCDTTQKDIDRKLHSDDKKLAVIEYRLNVNNWLTTAIAGGIIALVIKIFLGG